MNTYLKKFIEEKFKKPGKALDLGAGDFFDVACLKQLGWKCEGVDIKTGVNLEQYFLSKNHPFDLVFSNYVIHKIKNKEQFIKIVFDNLKKGGWFFIHTFDKKDKNSKSVLTTNAYKKYCPSRALKILKLECLVIMITKKDIDIGMKF